MLKYLMLTRHYVLAPILYPNQHRAATLRRNSSRGMLAALLAGIASLAKR